MATGVPGTLDLIRELSPYQWMELIGGGLQTLGVGPPGRRLYPFGPLGVLGAGLGQQAERHRRRGLLQEAAGQLPPEYSRLLEAVGESLPTDQLVNLLLQGQNRQQQAEATGYWPELYAAPPPETVLLEGEYLPPAERAEYEVGEPGARVSVPGTLTMAKYMERLAQVPARLRPHLAPSRALPLETAGPEQVRSLYGLYRRAGYPHQQAAAMAEAAVSAGLDPAKVAQFATPQRVFREGGYYTDRPGEEPAFTEVLTPQERAKRQRLTEFEATVRDVQEAAGRQGLPAVTTLRRLITQYGDAVPKDHPTVRYVEQEEARQAAARRGRTETTTTTTVPRRQIINREEIERVNGALGAVVNDLAARVPGFADPKTGTVTIPGAGPVAKTAVIERAFRQIHGIEVTVRWDPATGAFRVVQAWEPEQVRETQTMRQPTEE